MVRRIHNTMRKLCPVYVSHSEEHAHQCAELNRQLFIGTYFEEKEISRNKGKKITKWPSIRNYLLMKTETKAKVTFSYRKIHCVSSAHQWSPFHTQKCQIVVSKCHKKKDQRSNTNTANRELQSTNHYDKKIPSVKRSCTLWQCNHLWRNSGGKNKNWKLLKHRWKGQLPGIT